MALSAALLPMLIRDNTIVIVNETNRADIGISLGRTVGARKLEKGTPLFRAKDHSCRDAVARIAIVQAVRLIIMIDVMALVAAYELVAAKNSSIKGYPVSVWSTCSTGPMVKTLDTTQLVPKCSAGGNLEALHSENNK